MQRGDVLRDPLVREQATRREQHPAADAQLRAHRVAPGAPAIHFARDPGIVDRLRHVVDRIVGPHHLSEVTLPRPARMPV
jgi:hypothetical protein